MLKLKKIYVDTKYKTINSASTSDFSIQLPETIYMPDNSVFYIADVAIPHSFYTIETGINDKFYLQIRFNNFTFDVILTLDSKNYTGSDLAVEILTQLNKLTNFTDKFTITYDTSRHQIFIMSDFGYTYKVLTKNDIFTQLNGPWGGVYYSTSNSCDINTYILGLSAGNSPLYTSTSYFRSSSLDLQSIRNLYITSNSLGNFSTLGPNGQSNIIKKIPVTANYNCMIFDGMSSSNDFLDCSKQTLQNLEFRVENSRGDVINLNGQNISFSIIFDVLNKNS